MEFSHPLFLSRLEFSSMISQTIWKILFISSLMTPPSAVHSAIPQINRQQLLHPADLEKITSWSNTWNMSFNLDKSHVFMMSLKGPFGPPHHAKPESGFSDRWHIQPFNFIYHKLYGDYLASVSYPTAPCLPPSPSRHGTLPCAQNALRSMTACGSSAIIDYNQGTSTRRSQAQLTLHQHLKTSAFVQVWCPNWPPISLPPNRQMLVFGLSCLAFSSELITHDA